MSKRADGRSTGQWKFRNNSHLVRTDPLHKERWHKMRIFSNVETLQHLKETADVDGSTFSKILRAIQFWENHE